MQISKEQKEGLARVLDTLAVSAIIGALVGHAGYSLVTPIQVTLLYLASPILLAFAFLLRKPTK
jgi:hypothetical protein